MGSRIEDEAGGQDSALVQRHRAGDAVAFAELYARHYSRLVRYARSRVHDRVVAEDLAQEAFTQALIAIQGLRKPERFYAWLTVIARRLIARHHKASAQLCLVADVDPGGLSEPPESQLLRRLEEEDLEAAMRRLRQRHREILEMREGEGLSYDDIALRLGMPVTTVPPLLFRARQALRREYLSVSKPGRFALAPLALLFDAVRWVRAKAWHAAPTLQAAGMTSTAVAGLIAAAMGTALVPPSDAGDLPSSLVSDWSISTDASAIQGIGVLAGSAERLGAPRAGEDRASSDSDITAVTRYQPDVAVDDDEMRRRRAQSQHMPYSLEVGPTWIGIDPDQMSQDLRSSLSGDHEWMEG